MSWSSGGPGWWQASDGRWYPPESHPQYGQRSGQYAPPQFSPGPVGPPRRRINAGVLILGLVVAIGIVVALGVVALKGVSESVDTVTGSNTERAQDMACRIEVRTIKTAEQAYRVANDSGYVDELTLVPDWIEEESKMFDIELDGASGSAMSLRLVPVDGVCDGVVPDDELVLPSGG